MSGIIGSEEAREFHEMGGHALDARRELKAYLWRVSELPDDPSRGPSGDDERGTIRRLTNRQTDATGLVLSDRLVSRLEVLNALSRLPNQAPWFYRDCLRLHYLQGWPAWAIARAKNMSTRTVFERLEKGIDMMVKMIYDWVDAKPDSDEGLASEGDETTLPGYENRPHCRDCGAFPGQSHSFTELVDGRCPRCHEHEQRKRAKIGHRS